MTTNLIANKQIAIIGGGPVGLTTARLLQQKGATLTVYERDTHPTARMLGGSLDLHKTTGQKALETAGLLAAFYANARPVGQRMVDTQGQILMEMIPTADDLHDQPEIDRPDLRRILLESLTENTVVWDRQVVSVAKNGEGFELHFHNGRTATADLVIVADGAMSKARAFVTDTLPNYTGTYAIQGEVFQPEKDCPAIYKLANNGNMACIDDKKAIFIHSKTNGHLSFYASFRPSENWLEKKLDFENIGAVNAFLHDLFASWGDVYKELIDATNDYIGFPLRVLLVDKPWKSHANITLVGDAAHVMPPFGGEGVNMGLRDALALTENLTNGTFSTIEAAIDDYEKQMFAYALPIQQGTLQADERIHTQSETAAERAERVMKIMKEREEQNRQYEASVK